jgi:hypothetical protein
MKYSTVQRSNAGINTYLEASYLGMRKGSLRKAWNLEYGIGGREIWYFDIKQVIGSHSLTVLGIDWPIS